MSLKFNIDRPKITEEEINQHKDFDKLVKEFKQQSIKKARSDKSWWKNKYIKYSTVIAGITVVCTVTYQTLIKQNKSTAGEIKSTTENQISQKSTNAQSAFIQKPIKKIGDKSKVYKIKNSEGGEIVHQNKTKIKIPKNSFVNQKGELIDGEVEIYYNEFHNQADIIAAGIPMLYDSAGVHSALESAGMFEIKGAKDGVPVEIDRNKSITVELASSQKEDRFNQYFLDTVSRNWVYIRRDNPVYPKVSNEKIKPELKKLEDKYEPAIVRVPIQIDSAAKSCGNKISKLAKPAEPAKPKKASGKPQFELDVNYKEFPELAAFKNAVFELGDENKNFRNELKSVTWNDANISEGPDKGVNYLLTLQKGQLIEKLVVYPVLKGADYEKAQAVYKDKFEEYTKLLAKKAEAEQKYKKDLELAREALQKRQAALEVEYERQKAAALAKMNSQMSGDEKVTSSETVSRVFVVNRFGVYNSDCASNLVNGKSIVPVFITDPSKKPLRPDAVFLFEKEKNIVIRYTRSELVKFMIYPERSFQICVIVNDAVYSVSKEEYQSVVNGVGNKFMVTTLGKEIRSIEDLQKAIGI